MGNNIAIKVENLSKAYQLGQIGTGTISRDLERFWTTKIRGKADPFLKLGETNNPAVKGNSDIVWSLKDINFEIQQGDAVGIIGRNGAGKSTLLKLLSRVTGPSTGNIKVKGRIASLLEVGTGFHPELTGRENIYLNGAILGMRKKEITRKFDEIVDFSGVERYIDTPVKRYSSGMYVRLAFAVAAHLESEILIVDEVLAVGDAEFQNKCLGKMGEVSIGEGRTVLFVSHNMGSIKALCSSAILLNCGRLEFIGNVNSTIEKYISVKEISKQNFAKFEIDGIKLLNFQIFGNNGTSKIIDVCAPIKIIGNMTFENYIPADIKIEIILKNEVDQIITIMSTWLNSITLTPKKNELGFECSLVNGLNLIEGIYAVNLLIFTSVKIEFANVLEVELINNPNFSTYYHPLKPNLHGSIYTPNNWTFNE